MALDIAVENGDNGPLLKTNGEVDLYSSPQLREALLKAIGSGAKQVGLDLSSVGYMDSSGVATLVEALKGCNEKGAQFVIVAPSNAVTKVLQLARLDTVFDIRESL